MYIIGFYKQLLLINNKLIVSELIESKLFYIIFPINRFQEKYMCCV